MTHELLSVPADEYKKRLIAKTITVIAIFTMIVVMNILFCVFRTDSTHIAFLILNIVSDIACLWLLWFFIGVVFIPQKKLLALTERKNVQIVYGGIEKVSDKTKRVSGFNCYEISVVGNGLRTLFIIENGNIPTELKGQVKFFTVDNIVISAEADNE